jgi:hypothetical protein
VLLINRKFDGFEMALAPGIFGVHEPEVQDAASLTPEDAVYLRELREERDRLEQALETTPPESRRFSRLHTRFLSVEEEILRFFGRLD